MSVFIWNMSKNAMKMLCLGEEKSGFWLSQNEFLKDL